ncbi:MAG: hypothetical protein M0C28_07185 [Candidatus Moduliflexus flocculans]|nr:hypothetical protein [Candidatus Moduliflexus flocculans]
MPPTGPTELDVTAVVRNATAKRAGSRLELGNRDLSVEATASGAIVRRTGHALAEEIVPAGTTREVRISGCIRPVGPLKLWHFDHPHLHVAKALISRRRQDRCTGPSTTFGVREDRGPGRGDPRSTANRSAWPGSSAWPAAIPTSAWPSRRRGSSTTTPT